MKQEMININANLVAEPTFSSFEKDGEKIEVANFTLVKKYGKGKEYINCVAYGEKVERQHLQDKIKAIDKEIEQLSATISCLLQRT